ncbi:hypothetical protein [Maribacter sp. 2-571]|uniref:hypothetical protein n=1 Tax=Maribacter sp. 2-571 TaxID=3417569 RepID=UPI003D344C4C
MDFHVNNTDTAITVFLTFFSIAFGLFYYLAFTSLFKLKLSPIWPLFVVPPLIVVIVASWDAGYVPLAGLIHFPILALLMIFGGLYKWLKGEKKPFSAFLEGLGILILGIGIIATMPYSIIALFAYTILMLIVKPSKKSTFYELQTILPTSKIRSMAMGLVEVSGKTKMLVPVTSKIKKTPCIGYVYKIDAISKDKNGRKSYSNISTETVCNDFTLTDSSGTVTIKGSELSLLNLKESPHSYASNNKRYRLFLLLENMEVMLIGKATHEKQNVVIQRDQNKNIFALSPKSSVANWNTNRPLRQAFKRYALILVALISLVLLCDFTENNGTLSITFASVQEKLDLNKNLNFQFFSND